MWRFLQVSDPHLGSQTDGVWNNGFICTMMPEVMGCLRRDVAKFAPDFILATGDIASQQTRDAMFAARDLMDSLGYPYYPMGGNHDFVLEESRSWFIEAFQKHLPDKDTVYSYSHKGLHFCVLDPWWKWSDDTLCPFSERAVAARMEKSLQGARWALPPHQLAWLEHDLENHRDGPVVIALHYPAIPIPERLARPGLKDAGHLDNGGLFLELLAGFPQVKAVFAGHVHMHIIERVGEITHVITGALPEYPTEYREIQVHDDRLEVFTHPLSDSSFAQRSLIPGKDYTAGQPCDREAVIPLA